MKFLNNFLLTITAVATVAPLLQIANNLGVDLATGVATMMPDLVEVCITNSGHMMNPIGIPLTFRGQTIPEIYDFSIENMIKYVESGIITYDDDGFVRCPHGQHRLYDINSDPLFPLAGDGSWSLNYNVAAEMKRIGFKLENANKMVHIQTLEDPTHSSGLNKGSIRIQSRPINRYVYIFQKP